MGGGLLAGRAGRTGGCVCSLANIRANQAFLASIGLAAGGHSLLQHGAAAAASSSKKKATAKKKKKKKRRWEDECEERPVVAVRRSSRTRTKGGGGAPVYDEEAAALLLQQQQEEEEEEEEEVDYDDSSVFKYMCSSAADQQPYPPASSSAASTAPTGKREAGRQAAILTSQPGTQAGRQPWPHARLPGGGCGGCQGVVVCVASVRWGLGAGRTGPCLPSTPCTSSSHHPTASSRARAAPAPGEAPRLLPPTGHCSPQVGR